MKKKPHDVLVLNKGWAPIHIVDWKKAMSLLCTERVRAVDHVSYNALDLHQWSANTANRLDEFYMIKTASRDYALPEIIVAIEFSRLPQHQVKYSRQSVFARDDFTCGYCGNMFKSKELTIDHIVPRSQGGATSWNNVISSCFKCNQRKGGCTPAQANMKLLFKPHKPGWVSPLANIPESHPCKSWRHFMSTVATA